MSQPFKLTPVINDQLSTTELPTLPSGGFRLTKLTRSVHQARVSVWGSGTIQRTHWAADLRVVLAVPLGLEGDGGDDGWSFKYKARYWNSDRP